MSNALAVAHVTQALALLIESNLRPEIDMAVSVETRKPPAEPPTDPTITVFLYQVTHNPSMRNHDHPTRLSDGTLINKPVAALDLHYVISAYGEESELVGQRLIGCVARILREFPTLPADVIEEAAERPYLTGSDLSEAQQKVRFTPLQMDIDETSKLWGMLHQTPYSLSMTYQASLVLVEGREEPEPSRPVRRTEVRVGASGTPDSGNSAAGSGRSADGGTPGVAVVRDGGTAERTAAPDDAAASGTADAVEPRQGTQRTAAKSAAKATAAAKTTARTAAKKSAAKKQPAKKSTAKKSTTKPAAKKPTAKKTAAKKQARGGRPARPGGTRAQRGNNTGENTGNNTGSNTGDNTSDGKES